MKNRRKKYTQEHIEWAEQHKTLPRKQATEEFNKEFNKNVSKESFRSFCRNNRLLTGRIGSYTPVGTERNNRNGHIEIKVSDKEGYKRKSRVIYEQHNEKLTSNDVIRFYDGDITNIAPENLYKVTRYEHLLLNKYDLLNQHDELVEPIRLIAKLKANAHEILAKSKLKYQTKK